LLLLLAVPLACHATVFSQPSGWGWQQTATRAGTDGTWTIDPANSGARSTDTIWSTLDQTPLDGGYGASWYDIQGLGVHFNINRTTNTVTGFDWVLVAGYNGVEAPGAAASDQTRDGYSQGYHEDPMIRLNLNGDANWDYGLLVSHPNITLPYPTPVNQAQIDANYAAERAYRGFDYNGASLPSGTGTWTSNTVLYNVTPSDQNAWTGGYFISSRKVDIKTSLVDDPARKAAVTTTNGATHQLSYNKYSSGDASKDALWHAQNNRWYWMGSVDTTSLGWTWNGTGENNLTSSAAASYGMWCGNNMITSNSRWQNGQDPVPEPTSMVLLAMALGAGIRTARRRKTPKA